MKQWFREAYNTLKVTTLHPLGWGLHKISAVPSRVAPGTHHTPAAHPPRHEPILFVHGIFHNATAFYEHYRALKQRGFDNLHTVDLLTSVKDIHELASQLSREVELLHARTQERFGNEGPKVKIVAHSLGGMVVRAALLNPLFCSKVDTILFLGTPHQGLSLWRGHFIRSLECFRKGSSLMKRLKSEPLPGNIEYWNIRGDLDVVTLEGDTVLPNAHEIHLSGVGHAGLLSDPKTVRAVAETLYFGRPKF